MNFALYRTNIYALVLYTEQILNTCEWMSPNERIATHVCGMIMVGYSLQRIRWELVVRLGHTPFWHPQHAPVLYFLYYIGGEEKGELL